jgi:hypothetical protein
MTKKPEPPKRITWIIYKIVAKGFRKGPERFGSNSLVHGRLSAIQSSMIEAP